MSDSPETEAQPRLMYERIREQCELAVTYAEDGAYASALRVLRGITEDTRAHVACIMDAGL